MLEGVLGGVRLRLSLLFPASVIVILSLDDSGVAALCLLAALIHEGGHVAAMLLLHDTPSCITLGVFGMRVERRPNSVCGYSARCIVSLAGPLANAACAVLLTGEAALVHAVLAVFHILPVISLDGGEALYALLCRYLTEERADRVLLICSSALLFPIAVLGFLLMLGGNGNFSLLLLSIYLILRMFLREGH